MLKISPMSHLEHPCTAGCCCGYCTCVRQRRKGLHKWSAQYTRNKVKRLTMTVQNSSVLTLFGSKTSAIPPIPVLWVDAIYFF